MKKTCLPPAAKPHSMGDLLRPSASFLNFLPSTLLPFYPPSYNTPPQKLLIIFILLTLFIIQSQLPAKSQEEHQQQKQEEQLIRDVTLVDQPEWIKEKNKNEDNRLPLPDPLTIGIDMVKETLFKLTAAESKRTIAAGTLTQGMNMIDLPTDELFQQSGSHTYVLKVKAGEIEQEKIFILDIRIESDVSGSFSEMEESQVNVKTPIYEVSMFVGQTHIGSIQKTNTFLYGLLKDALKKRVDMPYPYDPAQPPNSRPPAVGIDPLKLASMFSKALKKGRERKKRESIRHVYVKQLSGGFYRKDKDGKEKPLDMTIKINSPQPVLKKN